MAKGNKEATLEKQGEIRSPSGSEKKWEATTLKKSLERSGERSEDFTTVSSYPINRLYTSADLPDFDYERDLGQPGQPP